ncbi:MAG TPA: tRNA pseudouridine(55) synthase, partial [Flavobacteriales bacterium]|nr:tRNA pseudouridine(55) synthase [Flavobacteriales bacterium]
MKIDLQQGEIWLVDKPYEWTSFDVLRKLKPALIR